MPRSALRALAVPLAMTCVLWAAALSSGAHAQQPAVVGVDEVRTEPLSQTVPVIGRLVARQSGVVAARTGGPVKEVPIKVGDRVQKGDVLAMIDTARIESEQARIAANLVEAGRQVESAQAQAKLRQQQLARLEGLRESVAFSQGRYEDSQQELIVAQSAIGVSEARLQNAEANLAMADLDLDWAVIRAPYPGVITLVHTEAGAWLNVGEQVVSMVNDQDLEIEADVPSNRILGLDPGVVVNLSLDDETEHLAIVRAIVPEENALTRTRRVRFTPQFNGTAKPLAVNQSAVVRLPLGPHREVVTVHKDAIITRQGQSFVYVANNGSADLRPIRLGEAVGTRFEVVGGVVVGDLVVVRGNERLIPGQPVMADGTS